MPVYEVSFDSQATIPKGWRYFYWQVCVCLPPSWLCQPCCHHGLSLSQSLYCSGLLHPGVTGNYHRAERGKAQLED